MRNLMNAAMYAALGLALVARPAVADRPAEEI